MFFLIWLFYEILFPCSAADVRQKSGNSRCNFASDELSQSANWYRWVFSQYQNMIRLIFFPLFNFKWMLGGLWHIVKPVKYSIVKMDTICSLHISITNRSHLLFPRVQYSTVKTEIYFLIWIICFWACKMFNSMSDTYLALTSAHNIMLRKQSRRKRWYQNLWKNILKACPLTLPDIFKQLSVLQIWCICTDLGSQAQNHMK